MSDKLTPEQQQMVLDNQGLVRAIVSKLKRHNHIAARLMDTEELVAVGTLGLCKAALSFDDSYGSKFSSYAWVAIRRSINEALPTSQVVKNPQSRFGPEREGMALLVNTGHYGHDKDGNRILCPAECATDKYDHVEETDVRDSVETYLDDLGPYHKEVVTQVYLEGNSRRIVAKKRKCSHVNIDRIVALAFGRIRKLHNIKV